MANEKFSQLPTVTNSTLSDIIAAVQGGVSSQETLQQIHTLFLANVVLNYAGNPNGNLAGVVYQLCWDKTNNILYTCTTSGNAATAVWTLSGSVAFPIPLSQGGTNKNITASNGAVVWCDANSFELTAVGSSGQMFQSSGAASPVWTTATYPATTTVSQLLYSSSANTIAGLATANSAMLYTNSSGVPAWSASMTNGQLMIGSTGSSPAPAVLTAGSGVSIAIGSNSITISTSGSGLGWSEVTGASVSMAVNTGYILNNAGVVTATLPASASLGDVIYLVGKGAGGWAIAQGASQTIHVGSSATTVGVGGSLASSNRYDSLQLVCTVANTTWTALGAPQSSGLTIV